MKIAILGFGTIGSGVEQIVNEIKSKDLMDCEVVKILDLPKNKDKSNLIVCDIKEISEDDSIDLVVETMGGIHPAYEFIMECLHHKKHVVTANKAVVAAHMTDFLQAAKEYEVEFRFEASTGGGIPWLASVQKARRVDEISSFYGIFNGTTNYILDSMNLKNEEFDVALKNAQELGYAEANPSADIDGYDVQNKVTISAALAFDAKIDMNEFPVFSMASITHKDIEYLKNHHQMIKYIGQAIQSNHQYEAFVMPMVFDEHSLEANIPSNFNIITLNGNTIGELKFYGQGAGKLPTANAIVQDILDIKNNMYYGSVSLDNELVYSDTLLQERYLIRTNSIINSACIDHIENLGANFYITTKAITTKEFKELSRTVLEKDEKAMIAKYM
ncbi:homoserine dehydrogenase [Floccifex sp.]|uniref:homoserine dehydrogenase n=1 Tax=Floccifex sp. TaxID=2815810 RepID=UPI002A747B1B|nr:homoserine dehydrogenase [Floccifex sp.]MDD7281688.1 homoserine dehydrogenase [Erysipelotrichaceae bacterium]MDY2958964.1 homoserine dehydrogenase [Floccifex sp.]